MHKKKVGIVALSIDKDLLHKKLLKSAPNSQLANNPLYEVEIVVFTQGFDYEGPNTYHYPYLTTIRDDSHYKKGLSISEIRTYFTERVLKEFNYDYLFIVDDDLVLGDYFCKALLCDMMHMESHPVCGIINMKYCKDNTKFGDPSNYRNLNPTKCYVRSGILLRSDAYNWDMGWGDRHKIVYFEEAALAMGVYIKGYDIVRSISDNVHISRPDHLGKTMEKTHANDFASLVGGRQVLCKLGYCDPRTDSDGNPDYRQSCKLHEDVISLHKRHQEELLK